MCYLCYIVPVPGGMHTAHTGNYVAAAPNPYN